MSRFKSHRCMTINNRIRAEVHLVIGARPFDTHLTLKNFGFWTLGLLYLYIKIHPEATGLGTNVHVWIYSKGVPWPKSIIYQHIYDFSIILAHYHIWTKSYLGKKIFKSAWTKLHVSPVSFSFAACPCPWIICQVYCIPYETAIVYTSLFRWM